MSQWNPDVLTEAREKAQADRIAELEAELTRIRDRLTIATSSAHLKECGGAPCFLVVAMIDEIADLLHPKEAAR